MKVNIGLRNRWVFVVFPWGKFLLFSVASGGGDDERENEETRYRKARAKYQLRSKWHTIFNSVGFVDNNMA